MFVDCKYNIYIKNVIPLICAIFFIRNYKILNEKRYVYSIFLPGKCEEICYVIYIFPNLF